MFVAPLIDSFGADKGLQFGVGEIVNSEYTVRAVEADEQGRIIHRCSRLSNGENVIVLCQGRSGQRGARPPRQSSQEMPSFNGTQPVGRFNVRFGNDMFAYVVYAEKVMEASRRQQADLTKTESSGETQQRPAPSGSRCVAYRKGNCELEVDIRAGGFDGNGVGIVSIAAVFVAVAWKIAYMVAPTALDSDSEDSFFWPMFTTGACLLFFNVIAHIFEHESLIITPAYFKIKRKISWKRRQRDSVNNPREAAEELTCLETLLCQQVFGDTKNLWKSKVQLTGSRDWYGDDTSTAGDIVLMEPPKKHMLGRFLTLKEKDWLVEEINEVLDSIRFESRAARTKPPKTPLGRKAR